MGDLITKANAIIEASYGLETNEKSIILVALSQIEGDVTDQVLYSLDLKSLSKITGVSITNAYRDFERAAISLYERKIRLDKEDTTLTRWVQTVKYNSEKSTIEVRFSHEILPYLHSLKDNFTRYNLRHVAKFKNRYAIRIYELMKQWDNTKKERDLMLDDMKYMFQLPSSYEKMSNLKKRVIDPAIEDINKHSDLEATYENIKKGRHVIGFKLRWKNKAQGKPQVIKQPKEKPVVEPETRQIDHEANAKRHQETQAKKGGSKQAKEALALCK